jgi:hypothetical protein
MRPTSSSQLKEKVPPTASVMKRGFRFLNQVGVGVGTSVGVGGGEIGVGGGEVGVGGGEVGVGGGEVGVGGGEVGVGGGEVGEGEGGLEVGRPGRGWLGAGDGVNSDSGGGGGKIVLPGRMAGGLRAACRWC